MKAVDIGQGAIALEIDSPSEKVSSLDKARLQEQGFSPAAIEVFLEYSRSLPKGA